MITNPSLCDVSEYRGVWSLWVENVLIPSLSLLLFCRRSRRLLCLDLKAWIAFQVSDMISIFRINKNKTVKSNT